MHVRALGSEACLKKVQEKGVPRPSHRMLFVRKRARARKHAWWSSSVLPCSPALLPVPPARPPTTSGCNACCTLSTFCSYLQPGGAAASEGGREREGLPARAYKACNLPGINPHHATSDQGQSRPIGLKRSRAKGGAGGSSCSVLANQSTLAEGGAGGSSCPALLRPRVRNACVNERRE